ncbi:unnamed protein product [Rodentolepis nana]|uniref:cyclin-dependent kinase n=1 Tax=Rodentolepis nana TaxID=102285 RepID=A0A0R3TNY0_RODNA|nr:unnamed protein product [Rodentolepis nana]
MERYEKIARIGEGAYGVVFKCRNRQTGEIVAIKKFTESEEDPVIHRIAMREIKTLKVKEESSERIQLAITASCTLLPRTELVGLKFSAGPDDRYTDYVATRWYRAPELLVGDTQYGPPVDTWAIGCVVAEMLTGSPLWPGRSDLDQLFQIISTLGDILPRHREVFESNTFFKGYQLPEPKVMVSLEERFSHLQPPIEAEELDFLQTCFQLNPADRATTEDLLKHKFLEEAPRLVSNIRLPQTLSQSKSLPSLSITPSGYSLMNADSIPPLERQNLPLCSPGDLVPRKPKVMQGSIYHSFKGWPQFDKSGPVDNFGVTGTSMTGSLSKMFCQRNANINDLFSKAQNKTMEYKNKDDSEQRITVRFHSSDPFYY